MKTSTKLFIVLLACIPLSMFAYVLLLKKQLDAENFYQLSYHSNKNEKFNYKALPRFKHIVVDGDLYVAAESSLTLDSARVAAGNVSAKGSLPVSWNAPVQISYSDSKTGYEVLERSEDIVKTKVRNDTLFVSFYRLNGEATEQISPSLGLVKIYTERLASLSIRNGSYKMKDFKGQKVSVSAENANLKISGMECQMLSLSARESTAVQINKSKLGLISYALTENSELKLSSGTVGKMKRDMLDSSSKISIEDDVSVKKD